jgi:UDP-N-acetylglucosamine--N-acetylmuramyl-(pentapeptide) pyrophosphoryl-undecaprenol N-acetylglucosamine transferase
MGVPLALLEPNSVLGLTNRVLSPLVSRAYVAFGDVDQRFGEGVALRSGVPLRSAFAARPYQSEADRFALLVLGGSQGARALNENVPAAAREVLQRVPHATIVHQAGRGNGGATSARYRAQGVAPDRVRVVEFIDDVAGELGAADVVIQRCGASAISEVCLVGRASILVPFPFAADQHQLANARSMERLGAAIALPQSEASPERLAQLVVELAGDPARRSAMATKARAASKPDAAATIAADLLSLAGRRSRGAA